MCVLLVAILSHGVPSITEYFIFAFLGDGKSDIKLAWTSFSVAWWRTWWAAMTKKSLQMRCSLFLLHPQLESTSTHLSCHKPAPHEHHSASHSEHIQPRLEIDILRIRISGRTWIGLVGFTFRLFHYLAVDGGKIGLFMITVLSCHLSCLRDCDWRAMQL